MSAKLLSNNHINFISNYLSRQFDVVPLTGDASIRRYFRIKSEKKSYIFCIDDNLKKHSFKDNPFIHIHKLFKQNNIKTPEVYRVDIENGLLLLEDLGNIHLEDHLQKLNSDEIFQLYCQIIDDLIRIQLIPRDKSLPFSLSFNTEKLYFEFNFFIENFLINYLNLKLSPQDLNLIKKHFYNICQILDEPDLFVLNHRDFHSRNIMLKNNKCFYIDFQDARLGIPHYDLVSLLRDSYLRIENSLHQKLKDYYFKKSKAAQLHSLSKEKFDYFYNIMGFQRNVKALGSFGYLIAVKGKKRYQNSIKTTIEYLEIYKENQPELQPIYILLKKIGAFKT